MTVLTLRRIRQDRFEVTGPDIEPVTFKTWIEARDLVSQALPGITDPGDRQEGCGGQGKERPIAPTAGAEAGLRRARLQRGAGMLEPLRTP
jgi:hypothetical protein